MQSIKGISSQNIFTFCKNRLNAAEVDRIIKESKQIGLSNEDELQRNLNEGAYIPVLTAIWAERDKPRRLEWLRKNTNLHAPLLYELALAEFVAKPTVETINTISIPLMKAAGSRIMQDTTCTIQHPFQSIETINTMEEIYTKCLAKQVIKLMNKNLLEILNESEVKREQAIKKATQEILTRSMSGPMPPPTWLGWPVMNFSFSNLLPESTQHQNMRNIYALQVLHSDEYKLP